MQNLHLCKTHRFTELLFIRSPMPIYIRKKNVEIFKLCQNCRNDVQFNSSLRKKEKKKLFSFFFLFFVLLTNKYKKQRNENLFQLSLFRFTCKNIPENKKQKPTSVFRFSFYLQKIPKRTKNENRLLFLVLFTVQTNSCFSFQVTVYEMGGRGKGGGEWLEPNHRGWLENTALCSLQREAPLRGAPAPWMTGRGYLRFQWKLITSKRSSQVELFISLSLIGCKNLRAILHNLSAKF